MSGVPDRPGYLPALDGLRALAVLAVVMSHSWAQALPGGWVGVDVFFVLSGFLITSILLREHDRTGRISFRNFYLRRALRLLPALALTLVLGVLIAYLLYPGSSTDTSKEAIAAVFYVANWLVALGQVHSGLLIHTWTLSIEEQFYWTWPLVLYLLLAVGGRRAALGATIVVVGIVLVHRLTGVQGSYFRTDTRADSLLIGCAIALAASAGLLERLPTNVIRGAAAVGALALGFVLALGAQTSLLLGVGYTVIGVAAATIVIATAVRPLGSAVRALSWHPLTWVGQRSYGVYLYHPLCLALLAPRLGTNGPIVFVGSLIVSLCAAGASYKYVETPFLRLKERAKVQEGARDGIPEGATAAGAVTPTTGASGYIGEGRTAAVVLHASPRGDAP